MIRTLPTYYFLFFSLCTSAQTILSGVIQDEAGEGLIGANVYLKDTYDGATSDAAGRFQFETFEEGEQTLVVSFVGFKKQEIPVEIGRDNELKIVLKADFNTMEAVTISAGVFEASDEKKAVVLKSLDIAMTAGATADITGALNTLPGTQKVGESGRLFVRGGESRETGIYIDGMETAGFYGTSGPGVPTRARFSPFLFKGTFFSSGGYSAEYGQALSSVLILNSDDPEPVSETNLSIMSIGFSGAFTHAWKDQSVFAEAGYTNLGPYASLVPQNVQWTKSPESWTGTFAYKKRLNNGGRLKSLGMVSGDRTGLRQSTDLNDQGYNEIGTKNQYYFGNLVAELPLKNDDLLYLGFATTFNDQDVIFNTLSSDQPSRDHHFKAKYNHLFSKKTVLNAGAELFLAQYDETLTDSTGQLKLDYDSRTVAGFAEVDQYVSEKLVFRLGMRMELNDYLKELQASPRFSMAYQLDDFSQMSFATGIFRQNPDDEYLRFSDQLWQETALHYILNYQMIRENRVFRIEGYYKAYRDLITFSDPWDPSTFSDDGYGRAYGVELFWRDRGGIENLDYWITWSWLKSERFYRDFPVAAAPGFTSEHNASFVMKRFFPALKSQMGATYSFTSGRPYDDPNAMGFNESLTPVYHDLSFNAAWLPMQHVVVYLSATNILGFDQVFGYRFSAEPETDGVYRKESVLLPAKRFLFLGCFITLGTNKNQLENL